MLSTLFTVLFIYLLVKLAMFLYRIHKVTSDYRKQFDNMTGGGRNAGENRRSETQTAQNDSQDSKRYDSGDGEYVDFVEIKGDRPETGAAEEPEYTSGSREEYITDVEFEEIIDENKK